MRRKGKTVIKKFYLRYCGILAFFIFTFCGCGYTTRSMITNQYRTIYITPFINKIDITSDTDVASKYKVYRPMLETEITKSVVNKFLTNGNLRPSSSDSADLSLKGELVEFRRDPLRYTSSDEVEEYRLNLVVNISLWDKKEEKMLWEENGFTGDTTYFTIGSALKSEDTAIKDAVSDLSRRIVERAVEQW